MYKQYFKSIFDIVHVVGERPGLGGGVLGYQGCEYSRLLTLSRCCDFSVGTVDSL